MFVQCVTYVFLVSVHPGIATTMLKLLPLLRGRREDERSMELSAALQWHAADVIKSLLRTEKNQQVCFSSFRDPLEQPV